MSLFSWMFGNSRSAARARAERRGLRLFDPGEAERQGQVQPATDAAGGSRGSGGPRSIDDESWFNVISSNVDRIRYHAPSKELQVVFKSHGRQPARGYQYEQVESEIFEAFKRTHSPGQFVWYVLRQYGYRYHELGGNFTASAAAAPRYDEQPFAVSPGIEEIQRRAGRRPMQGGLFNFGTPRAAPYNGPDTGASMVPLD